MIRLWPRSLAGQLMLVTALALFVGQVINLGLLLRAESAGRLGSIAAGSAAQIAEASDRIALGLPLGPESDPVLPDRQRMPGPPAGSDGGRLPPLPETGPLRRKVTIGPAPAFRPDMVPWPDLARRVATVLDEAGVAVRAVDARQSRQTDARSSRLPVARSDRPLPRRLVIVAAQLPDGRWITMRARVPDAGARFGGFVVIQTGILLVLLLSPIMLVAWRVTRPLTRLARAAQDIRPGAAAEPLVESGPEDVRALTRAFNVMRERIRAMLTDKDRMLGAIGHDLRTPLASLRVRVEQVGDEALRDKLAATITEMAAMLNDILSLARVGQPGEIAQQTDLAALIGDVVADYQAMGQPVSLHADGDVATALIRPAALRRALRNIVDNAVTYGQSATLGLQAHGDAVVLSVDDDGPGIAEAEIARMFDPFVRAEESRNRDTGGSGLGLTLARGLVEAEGGTLILVNRPEGGLSAQIRLPRHT